MLASALALGLLASGAAFAQTAPATPATPAAAAPAKPAATTAAKPAPAATTEATKSDADKKAKSKECYDQADKKDLHGKERKKFHRTCMKAD